MPDDTVVEFDDDAFASFCLQTYDRNGDGVLTVGEIKDVTSLAVDDQRMRSLGGIEYFTGLQGLYCNPMNGGNLERLDVSRNPELRYLDCKSNKLEYLNISGLKMLSRVDCGSNRLCALDLQGLPQLEILLCGDNRLEKMDLSGAPALTSLDCSDNKIADLDLNPCEGMQIVWCTGNEPGLRVTLDWRQTPVVVGDDDADIRVEGDEDLAFAEPAVEAALAELSFDKNRDGRISRHEARYVRELFGFNCDRVGTLADFSYFVNLYWCELVSADKGQCKLRSLDTFARNERLQNLDLMHLPVASVDLSKFPALKSLRMSACDVEELDVSGLQHLEGLECSNSPALKMILFKNNSQMLNLSHLGVDQHTLLRYKGSD